MWTISEHKEEKNMLVTKSTQDNLSVYVKNNPIERVGRYNCLGTTNDDEGGDGSKKIRTRIDKANSTFVETRRVL